MKETLCYLTIKGFYNGFRIYKKMYKNYSTVTDFARFLGLSTSNPFSFEM